MENKPTVDGPEASTPSEDCINDPSTPAGEGQVPGPRDWSDSSPQSSPTSQPSDESKPQESSPSTSSPNHQESLGATSSAAKERGTPQSQKTPKEESKPRRCVPCNPVHVCLVLGVAVALGSIAMTACGYMSHKIAVLTVVVGNDTITTMNEDLRVQIEKFKTFGPVLIGLGSFISMCACVLMCEARDERKREAKKQQDEEQEYDDYQAVQQHMYALQCEVMAGTTVHVNRACPYYHKGCPHAPKRQLEDVAFADESSHSSPVVLVHGPSLADEKQRNDSQESNESVAAKAALLKENHQQEDVDVSSIPTCSNYVEHESGPDAETSFTATPRTLRKGVIVSSPPAKRNNSKLERPSQLSPMKSRSVNGPILVKAMPPVEGVCLCGGEPTRAPYTSGKSKRVKRGTRPKKKHLENMSAGSDPGSGKSVPRNTKCAATQNTDLITHVNPLHDIPLVNYTSNSPHRTSNPDRRRSEVATGIVPSAERSGATASLAPVEITRDIRPSNTRISDRISYDSKGHVTMSQIGDSENPVWVKQQPHDSSNHNNSKDREDGSNASKLDARGAICKSVCDKSSSCLSESQCDSNCNVSTMSSMQLSPKATPSNIIHDKTQHAHSSESEVVL